VENEIARADADADGLRLVGEDLAGRDLSCVLARHSSLTGCALGGANLNHALLESVRIEDCDFTEADLTSVQGRDLLVRKSRFDRASFARSTLTQSSFTDNSMRAIHAAGITAEGVDLGRSDLTDADLSFAYMSRTDLSGCDLNGADFTGATFSEVRLSGAGLKGVTFNRTEMLDVTLGVTGETFITALRDLYRLNGRDISYAAMSALSGDLYDIRYDPSTGALRVGGDDADGIARALDAMGVKALSESYAEPDAAAGALSSLLGNGLTVLARFSPDVPGLDAPVLRDGFWGVVDGSRGEKLDVTTLFADHAPMEASAFRRRLTPASNGLHVLFGVALREGVPPPAATIESGLAAAGTLLADDGRLPQRGLAAYGGLIETWSSKTDTDRFARGLVSGSDVERLGLCRRVVVQFLGEAISLADGNRRALLEGARERYMNAESGLMQASSLLPYYIGTPGGSERRAAVGIVASKSELLRGLIEETYREERRGLQLIGEALRAR